MEFGRVTSSELDTIDFTLPPDKPETQSILKKSTAQHTKYYVGCAKWGRKDWVGKIYPKGTKDSDFLLHYAKHFSCIELNATFYRMPTYSQTAGWRAKVGEDFKFCPKFVDQITHIKRLKDVDELLDRFFEGISGFENNLGPVFLMPHPGMGPKTLDTIEAFIQKMPKDIELFIELRHAQWFADHATFQHAFATFEKYNVGSVITDASGRRDCVHMRLTTPKAFIRFVGNGLHPSDYTRCDDWINRMKQWQDAGIDSIYFFMHQHEELHSPELCQYLITKMNETLGTSLRVPEFVKG